MSVCQSCGGVIGRDCYNPQECMAITQDMANRYQQQGDSRQYASHLEGQIVRMNDVFGKIRMQCPRDAMSDELWLDIDSVMTREYRE